MKLGFCPQDMHLKSCRVARTALQSTRCLPAAAKYLKRCSLEICSLISFKQCLMLWVNDCLLAVSDVEGTSAVLIAPLTIPGRLVGGSMQHPQLHASLQQLPHHISVVTPGPNLLHTPHFDPVPHVVTVLV